MDLITELYLVDDDSLKWLIVNEIIGERYCNNRYNGKFIVKHWKETETKIYVRVKFYDNNGDVIIIDKSKSLKIIRKLKIKQLNDDFNNDFYSFDERVKVNKLRLERLERICNTAMKTDSDVLYGEMFRTRREPNNKLTKQQKRRKLAKENRGQNKSKNK